MNDAFMDSIMAEETKLNWNPVKTFLLDNEIICAGVFPSDNLIQKFITWDAKRIER